MKKEHLIRDLFRERELCAKQDGYLDYSVQSETFFAQFKDQVASAHLFEVDFILSYRRGVLEI